MTFELHSNCHMQCSILVVPAKVLCCAYNSLNVVFYFNRLLQHMRNRAPSLSKHWWCRM